MLRCFETTITICACGWGNVFLVLAAMTVPSLMPPIFRLFGARLAVQGRYNVNLFHRVLSRSLQGIAERPLPCNYFHGGNTGSNPVGDAKPFQELASDRRNFRRHKK